MLLLGVSVIRYVIITNYSYFVTHHDSSCNQLMISSRILAPNVMVAYSANKKLDLCYNLI